MVRVWLLVAAFAAQLPAVPPDARIHRLQQWITLVEQHHPGTVDLPATVVRWWDRSALSGVRDDLQAIRSFICGPCPDIEGFQVEAGAGQPRSPVRGYSRNQLLQLRFIADDIGRRHAMNDLLKRGALLHTDIAFRAPASAGPIDLVDRSPLQRNVLYLDDGRPLGLNQSVGHLELAARLLDIVTPNPDRDEKPNPQRDATVRAWYRATTAILAKRSSLDLTFYGRALRLFPDDAEVLLMAGALHETLAAPRIQDAVRTARLPTGMSYAVGSERDELREAERFFRRSLLADPARVETRVRLGRVLGLSGRPADAARELRAAAASAREPIMQYFASLFLGREADALGDLQEARAAYERAMTLYPGAQSPRVAFSELLARRGQHAAALATLDAVWRLPPNRDDREDPMWAYYELAGREGEALMAGVNAVFTPAEAP
jgi:tetratricopeptide (TPR) repeat protein